MKCYVLMVSRKFPAYHPRKGEETWFSVKIIGLSKIHTIRKNYDLWEKRFKEIEDGTAYLSIRAWSGKPYHSKQLVITNLFAKDGIGIEKLEWVKTNLGYLPTLGTMTTLAINDGLTVVDFCEWFKHSDYTKPMALIHFTNFRYKEKV